MSTEAVRYISDGYHTVTAYWTVDDAAKAIEFYAAAFGATELFRLPMGDKLGHAEVNIGDTHVMRSDEFTEMNIKGPNARAGPTAAFMIHVEDADAAFGPEIRADACSLNSKVGTTPRAPYCGTTRTSPRLRNELAHPPACRTI